MLTEKELKKNFNLLKKKIILTILSLLNLDKVIKRSDKDAQLLDRNTRTLVKCIKTLFYIKNKNIKFYKSILNEHINSLKKIKIKIYKIKKFIHIDFNRKCYKEIKLDKILMFIK